MSYAPLYLRKKKLLSSAVAGSLAVGAFYSSGSLAQENKELEEVYVTATKRDERLIDVPMAVSALAGDELVVRNLLQIEDFADQIPGLVIQKFGNRATRVVLRGLNSGGAGATVATMIDEAYLSYSSSTSNGAIDIANLDTYDLARIEVLRGPQGTLYGAAAEGGIVKYVTNPPNLEEFEGDAEFIWENIEQGESGYTARGIINVPLVEGTAAFRASGFFKEIAGYIDNNLLGRKDANSGERYGGRFQFLYQPSDRFSIKLSALLQDQDYDDPGNVEVVGAAFTPNVRSSGEFKIANGGNLEWNTPNPSISDNELRLYSAEINWTWGNVNLLSATSYGEINSTFRNDITFLELAPGVPINLVFAPLFLRPDITVWGNQTNDLEKLNQEFRLSSIEPIAMGDINFDWQVGAFYSEEEIVFNQFFDALDVVTGEVLLSPAFVPLGFPPLPLGGSSLPADYEETSVFAEVVAHFSEKFEVAVGGRYSTNDQFSQVTNEAGLINAPVTIFNDPLTSDEDEVTWSIAPKYYIAEDHTAYARIATGYRPGGPALAIPGAPPDFPTSYGADSTVNYEVGFKGKTEDGRFVYDVAAFFIDWEDIQIITTFVSEASGQRFNITGNAGTAESYGLEWNFSWEVSEGLVLSTNGAYTVAELTESAPGLGGVDGDQLPLVPKLTNTLNIDYTKELNGIPVTTGLTWVYVGERYTGFGAPLTPDEDRFPGSHVELPTYSTVAANVTASFENYRVRLFAQNLTDKRGLTGYITGGGFGFTGQGQIIQPRTIGIAVGASF